jgi:hypothetical protein
LELPREVAIIAIPTSFQRTSLATFKIVLSLPQKKKQKIRSAFVKLLKKAAELLL